MIRKLLILNNVVVIVIIIIILSIPRNKLSMFNHVFIWILSKINNTRLFINYKIIRKFLNINSGLEGLKKTDDT